MVLATGSTDQSGSYVFAVEPQGLGRSFSKEGHYWKAADGFDTMFTLWNPADKQQDFLVTFFFGQREAPYKLPVTLGLIPQRSQLQTAAPWKISSDRMAPQTLETSWPAVIIGT